MAALAIAVLVYVTVVLGETFVAVVEHEVAGPHYPIESELEPVSPRTDSDIDRG